MPKPRIVVVEGTAGMAPGAAGTRVAQCLLAHILLVTLTLAGPLEPPDPPDDGVPGKSTTTGLPAAAGVETTMVGLDDALTSGAGLSELELTVAWSRARDRLREDGSRTHRADNDLVVGTATFTHGITSHVDVTVSTFGVAYHDDDSADRRGREIGDVFVDVKWRFKDAGDSKGSGAGGLQLAWRPGLSIPLGEEEDGGALAPGFGHWTLGQAIVGTWVKRRWVLGFEGSVLLPFGDRDTARAFGAGSVGTGYVVTPRVKPELELQYLRDFFAGAKDSEVLAMTAGVILNVSGSLRLDLGLRQGLWGRNVDRRLTASANVSLTFGNPTR